MEPHPILWSFRRCPYAMRARLAVASAGVTVELREILLRDKPQAFLDTSQSATVPALKHDDLILDESLDIMVWALKQSDPQGLLEMPDDGWTLIDTTDGPFKTALDHTKYAVRYPDNDPEQERAKAAAFLEILDPQLGQNPWLFGPTASLADFAILPFVRQFANIDRAWFDAQPWPNLRRWLDTFTASATFTTIMDKYPPWTPDQPPVWFGKTGVTA